MSTIIKYLKDFDIEITEEEANEISNFTKDIIIDNFRKISEGYKEGELYDIIYYMESNENLADLISQYASYHQRVTFIKLLYAQNGYKVYEEQTYQQGNLIRKVKRVDAAYDETIVMQFFETTTDLPMRTEKFHLDSENNIIYHFEYNSTGNLTCVTDWREHDGPIPASMLSNPDVFDWTGLEFYRSAEPLIPGT